MPHAIVCPFLTADEKIHDDATAFDSARSSGSIFWVNASRGEVNRADLEGRETEVFINSLAKPHGLALDAVKNELLVSSAEGNIFAVPSARGSSQVDPVQNCEMTQDPSPSTLCWIQNPRIVLSEVCEIRGFDVELDGNDDDRKIFYSCDDSVRSARLSDGNDRKIVASGFSSISDIGIYNGQLYIADYGGVRSALALPAPCRAFQ